MPLLALSLTQDTRLISAVSFSSMIPWLFLSLPAGVFIDRWDRRVVMIVADSLRAIMYTLVAVLVAVDTLSIWVLLVILFVIGCAEVFFDMSAQAFLPSIVTEDQLHRANGLLYAAEIVWGSFIGLPIGSWLFVVAAAVPFGINGASFALAAVLVASITVRRPTEQAQTDTSPRSSFVTDLKEGLRWLGGHRNLRTLAVLLGVTNGAMMLGEAIFVKFAFRYLGVGPKGYGLLLAVTSEIGRAHV